MIILFISLIGIVIFNDLKKHKLNKKQKKQLIVVFVAYSLFMIYYLNFINNQPTSFGMGIPQADMLEHFKGAEALAKGAKWSDLSSVAPRFSKIGISTIGYFLYTTFLAVCIFEFKVFSIEINVYLIYFFQLLLSIDTSIKLNYVFNSIIEKKGKKNEFNFFMAFAVCIPFIVQASQLMRDVYYMWFIALIFELVIKYKENITKQKGVLQKEGVLSKNTIKRICFCLALSFLSFICICIRFYSVVVFFPLVFYFLGKNNISFLVSCGLIAMLIVGTAVLQVVKNYVGIPWEISNPDYRESLRFLLFPNIINQTDYLLHWKQTFGNTIDVGGCNVPGVYYFMSIWNIGFMPLTIVGTIENIKHEYKDRLTWFLILISIVFIYSITYDSIDNRHKFFMSLPICYLAGRGYNYLSRKFKYFGLVYGIVILLIVSSLIICFYIK